MMKVFVQKIEKLNFLTNKSGLFFSRGQPQTKNRQIVFPFPFQYTLGPQNFLHYDVRFTQEPINRNLHENQIKHINFVFNLLQTTLNHKKTNQQLKRQYIHPLLLQRGNEFTDSLKETKIHIQFKFIPQSILKSEGYMQIQFKNAQKTKQYLTPKYIHEYMFQKQKQVLKITQIPKKQKKTQQSVLKQDLHNVLTQKTNQKQIRQAFDERIKDNQNSEQKTIDKLFSKIFKLGSKTVTTNKIQSYLTIDLIKGKLMSEVRAENNTYKKEVEVYSKWVYFVQKNQSQSIKNSRKRMLFDFQFWNRGTFIPVKQFSNYIQEE